jgi:hypothetical protein
MMPDQSDRILPDSDPHSLRGDRPRLFQVGLLFLCLLLIILPYVLYRVPGEHGIRRIQSVGGIVTTGRPTGFLYDYSKRHLPTFVVESKLFERLFVPGVYAVDLRNVSDPDHVMIALKAAASFPSITSITLYQSGANDRHVALIARQFPAVTDLKLNETSISDAAIAQLPSLERLRALNIQRTAVTDAAIEDLLAIPRLKELIIAQTQITDVARLRTRCRVIDQLVTRTRTVDYHRLREGPREHLRPDQQE